MLGLRNYKQFFKNRKGMCLNMRGKERGWGMMILKYLH